jgi:hypothetical protein
MQASTVSIDNDPSFPAATGGRFCFSQKPSAPQESPLGADRSLLRGSIASARRSKNKVCEI